MANSNSETTASAALVASTAIQNHPPNPQLPQVIFTQPNMNHNLNIKLSKGNFMAWRTQILAYIKGQDSNGFLDGSSKPSAQTIPNLLLMLEPYNYCQSQISYVESKGSNDPQCPHLHTYRTICCSRHWLCYILGSMDHLGHHVCFSSSCSSYANLLPTNHGLVRK